MSARLLVRSVLNVLCLKNTQEYLLLVRSVSNISFAFLRVQKYYGGCVHFLQSNIV
jgi:hypothetical protein